VQETVTVPTPSAGAETVFVLPKIALLLEAVVADAGFADIGFEALHVMGTPVIVWPAMSTTLALSVVEAPLVTRNEMAGGEGQGKVKQGRLPTGATEICCRRQVSIEIGWLLSPLAVA
jgi:hypothetical protein